MHDGNKWICAACCPLAARSESCATGKGWWTNPLKGKSQQELQPKKGTENQTAEILSPSSGTVHLRSPPPDGISSSICSFLNLRVYLRFRRIPENMLTIKGLLDMLGPAIGCPKGVMEGLFWPKTGNAGPWGSTENVKGIAHLKRSHFPTPLCWLTGAGTVLVYSCIAIIP